MTKREAKDLLRRRYARKGYRVERVREKDDLFVVSFGTDADGVGLGPNHLSRVTCHWPLKDPGAQQELELKPRRRKARA